jgi:hypothetical protein
VATTEPHGGAATVVLTREKRAVVEQSSLGGFQWGKGEEGAGKLALL